MPEDAKNNAPANQPEPQGGNQGDAPDQYQEPAPPPQPDSVPFQSSEDVPAVPWSGNMGENPADMQTEEQIKDALDKAGYGEDGDNQAVPDPVQDEIDSLLGKGNQTDGPPEDGSTPEAKDKPEDAAKDDFEFPEPDTPVDLLEAESGPSPTPDDAEMDVSGILKKYIGDEADETVLKAAEPIAKAYKHLQQQNTLLAQEIGTLKELFEKLGQNGQAQQQEPQQQADDGDAGEQPSQKAEAPADAELQMPSEEELEEIVAEEGYTGLYKRMLDDARKLLTAQQQQAQQQQSQEQAKKLEQERAEHNNKVFMQRVREFLRDKAIARKDKAAFQKYNDEKYVPTEDEVVQVFPELEREVEILRQFFRPDDTGKFHPEHLEYAKRLAYFDKYIEKARMQGYNQALQDIKSGQSKRVSAVPKGGVASEDAGTFKIGAASNPTEVMLQVEHASPDKIEAEIARLRKQGLI